MWQGYFLLASPEVPEVCFDHNVLIALMHEDTANALFS